VKAARMTVTRSIQVRLTIALSAATAVAFCVPAAAAAATPTAAPVDGLISMSGTVANASAEWVSHGVIHAPATTPPVPGARIEVDGRTVAQSGPSGRFSFVFQDPNRRAVTIAVSAPGFGTYTEHGVTPAETGDLLTVQLTRHPQTVDGQSTPGDAPSNRERPSRSRAAGAGIAGVRAAANSSNCGGYYSNTTPPSSINVLEYAQHTSSGAPVPNTETGVFNVPFETYVQDVLPNEWIASWQPAALDAGAMAVKSYAWYWVNNWAGLSYGGACYNVDDSTNFMRYIPGQSYPATNTAITDTWNDVMTQGGSIFESSFQETLTGSTAEACGAGLSNFPNTMSQYGSQTCALDGDSWQTIVSTYYQGVTLNGHSSSPVSIDGAGDDVAFVNASGQVSHDWGTSSGWKGPAAIGGTARADSPVVENAAGNVVVFIDASGQVVNDWADPSTGWHGPAAIGGTARAGSGLAMSAAGDVAFVNTSGQVVHDWATSSGWKGPAAIGGTARADSPLVEDDNGDTVFFIDPSGQVVNDWADPSTGWHGPAPIGGTARAGSGLASNDSGRDVVFTDTSGNVVNDWGTGPGTGWAGPAPIGGTARPGSAIAHSGGTADVVFFNPSGQVVNDWGTSTGWAGPAPIGGTALAGSGIAQSDNGQRVVFINPSGQVVNDWGTSTGWAGPAAIGGTAR
jgi:stage II sporulation SpoD-like protein